MARKDYRRGPAEGDPTELPPVELPAGAADAPPAAAGAADPAAPPRKYRYRVANAFVQVTGEAVGTSPEQVTAAVASWLTAGLTVTEG